MSFDTSKLEDPEIANSVNFIIHGDNGVGKTPLIAESPGCIIIDSDHGAQSASGSGAKIWSVQDFDDLWEIHGELAANGHPFGPDGWVWLDGIASAQDLGLEQIMVEVVATNQKGNRKIDKPDRGEYGENMVRLKRWVRRMCALPVNFGVTSYTAETEDAVTGEIVYMPYVQGKGMPQSITGSFSIVGYMRMKEMDGEEIPVMDFKRRKNFYARDRFGVLPASMGKPSMEKILTAIGDKVQYPANKKETSRPAVKKAATKPAVKKAASSPTTRKAPAKKVAAKRG